MTTRIRGGACVMALLALFVACSSETVEFATHRGGPTPGFVDPDAGPTSLDASFTSYCPSDKCPVNRTECPGSRFPCDVDLKTDRANCGACGVVCPTKTSRETYECVDGQCALQCNAWPPAYDCDGTVDNGCETLPSNDNCGGCGIQCADPAKPCLDRLVQDIGCGCHGSDLYCAQAYPPCVNATIDDQNCGACGNACDRTGGGAPSYPNTYYGCDKSQCGALKCSGRNGDCDNNAVKNGCETSLLTGENCGHCGNACAAGQECRIDVLTQEAKCMCPDGQTFCGFCLTPDFCMGRCYDLASDRDNCGACGNSCARDLLNGRTMCNYGTCEPACDQGRADCNGNMLDGCEIDTSSDPRNCGGCGNVCDAIAGQACVAGRCVVEPCNQDAGGGTR